MKKGIIALVLAVLAAVRGPFVRRDVSQLQPARTLSVFRTETGQVRVETEAGLSGTGENWETAVAQLEADAPGYLFLSTAEQVVLEQDCADVVPEAVCSGDLRPAARLYLTRGPADPEKAGEYLQSRRFGPTAGQIRRAISQEREVRLPLLTQGNLQREEEGR